MNGSRPSCKIALAALLTTVACGCAPKLGPHSGSALPDAVPEKAETTFAPERQNLSHTAENPKTQAPGLIVHIDPLTGQILPKPPVAAQGQVQDSQQLQAAPVPAPQAVERPSPVRGGGITVNLNRQFHQPLFATINDEGKVKLEHRPAYSELGAK